MIKPDIVFLSLLQPKLMAKDLLDLVASHFNLKEKEYFGISYVDETYVFVLEYSMKHHPCLLSSKDDCCCVRSKSIITMQHV